MSEYSCDCGKLSRPISSLNEVVKDLICPLCNSKLKIPCKPSIQTKLESYISLDEGELSKMRQLIFNELSRAPATDRELTKRLGFDVPNKVRPRRKEMVDMNPPLVKAMGKRPCQISHKNVTEWGIA